MKSTAVAATAFAALLAAAPVGAFAASGPGAASGQSATDAPAGVGSTAGGPQGVNPADYDLVGLAMQEPQYRSPGVRELLDAVGKAKLPLMSIMNMPPLPYLARIPGINTDALKSCYTDASVWASWKSLSAR